MKGNRDAFRESYRTASQVALEKHFKGNAPPPKKNG
jgi:hypothetical protein